MNTLPEIIISLLGFLVVALAASHVGNLFARWGLPKITGYLFTGIITGSFILDIIHHETPAQLLFIDELSLGFIAFAAGSELYLPEIKGRLRTISYVTAGLVLSTLVLCLIVVLLLADAIPFMQSMNTTGRLAVALLVGAILVARSPSSAIAIVNELRAKGPFTQMALGVTVIMDVIVIVIFAINSSIATALLTNMSVSLGFVLLIVLELVAAFGAGFLIYKLLDWLLTLNLDYRGKIVSLLLTGYLIFALSHLIQEYSHSHLHIDFALEPLLICLTASFLVNNYSRQRMEMSKILHDTGPYIYVLFFTLTGASLELDILLQTWRIALALFATRLIAIVIGSFVGGTIAGDSFDANRLKWMAFVTQAGVALGLAKDVAVRFPELGNNFATLIISVVVINESIGPLFFKRAIKKVGESHTRADMVNFDGIRDAIIFGCDAQAIVLCRQLQTHGWQVKLACPRTKRDMFITSGFDVHDIPDHLTLDTLQKLEIARADAVVLMLSEIENYHIGQFIYEYVGIEHQIALLQDHTNIDQFQKLGIHVVHPSTAMISLLDYMVRAPSAASILLGLDENQDIIDLELRDPTLDGVPLRHIRLPLGVVLISIHRKGQVIRPHGYTQLQLGDIVTLIGELKELEEVTLRFDAEIKKTV